jgi:hypothetical protein
MASKLPRAPGNVWCSGSDLIKRCQTYSEELLRAAGLTESETNNIGPVELAEEIRQHVRYAHLHDEEAAECTTFLRIVANLISNAQKRKARADSRNKTASAWTRFLLEKLDPLIGPTHDGARITRVRFKALMAPFKPTARKRGDKGTSITSRTVQSVCRAPLRYVSHLPKLTLATGTALAILAHPEDFMPKQGEHSVREAMRKAQQKFYVEAQRAGCADFDLIQANRDTMLAQAQETIRGMREMNAIIKPFRKKLGKRARAQFDELPISAAVDLARGR